ncbi:MAG: SIS domain-containing protein [Acidobacteria bacterium]|nr:SIS domain-containing protein [Acidobacteriota bacterium]
MGGIARYLEEAALVTRAMDPVIIRQVSDVLLAALREGRQVFLFGNGGSAATASHFAVDLGKGLQAHDGRRLKALALTDAVPVMTAWANDTDYSRIFSEQLANFACPGDVAIAISGSGNSPNVLKGVRTAIEKGALTIAFTGDMEGKLKEMVDLCVVVPSSNMQHIEDCHMIVAHVIYTDLRERLAAGARAASVGRPAAFGPGAAVPPPDSPPVS